MNSEITLLPVNHICSFKERDSVPSNITFVGAQEKWRQGFYGKGVVVAVVDTGCEMNHPDLKERIIGGYNFTEDYNGDVSIYEDLNGHGTHVAGVIASSMNNSGIVGVAPKANLLILKVLNKRGTGSVESLIESINYAVNWRGMNGERVRVISLSLGLKNPSQKLHDAIQRAVKNNICVVAASGNDGDGNITTSEYRYPGAYEEVITVGALNKENELADFSNTHEFVDVYAPGAHIYSTSIENGYTELSGTSMATPHVTGAIALLIEEYEYLFSRKIEEEEIYNILMKHTSKVDLEGGIAINMLNLNSPVQSIYKHSNLLERKNRDMLLKCFCEARRTQAFFTKCLDEHASEEERTFMIELIKKSAETSKKIKDFCE